MVNPARAGMILRRLMIFARKTSKPRACGDDPKHHWEKHVSKA